MDAVLAEDRKEDPQRNAAGSPGVRRVATAARSFGRSWQWRRRARRGSCSLDRPSSTTARRPPVQPTEPRAPSTSNTNLRIRRADSGAGEFVALITPGQGCPFLQHSEEGGSPDEVLSSRQRDLEAGGTKGRQETAARRDGGPSRWTRPSTSREEKKIRRQTHARDHSLTKPPPASRKKQQ
jgi:hypothetical protein